jgi:RNA polymerase sigma-70 factor (ECF subfamily)
MIQKNIVANQFDKETLVKLYEENNEALYRYAYRYLSDQDLAEECVSEVFTRYLQVLKDGKNPTDNTKAYLYRIAHNWVVDHYRKRKPEENIGEDPIPDRMSNPEMQFSKAQIHEKLRRALLKLPEQQRRVIELHILEEWSHEEIAEQLGKTIEASRALQYRGLLRLRKTLDEIGMWKNELQRI